MKQNTRYTAEQLAAINYSDRERSAVVSASAGSGKTAVLVEHIAALICDKENPVRADKLAAVTFTEKAAAELRRRLSARIEELSAENPEDEFLLLQSARLSSANISTISSFCLSFVRDNSRLLDIDEDFSVGDETLTALLSQKAMKKAFEKFYEEFPREVKEETRLRLGGEKNIAGSVLKLKEFISNTPFGVERVKDEIEILSNESLYEKKYVLPLKELTDEILDDKSLAEKIDKILLDFGEQTDAALTRKLSKHFSEKSAKLRALRLALKNDDYDEILKLFSERDPACPSYKKYPELSQLDAIKKEYKNKLEQAADCVQTLVSRGSDRAACERSLRLLLPIEEIYDKEYTKLKTERGIVDFSDLEQLAFTAAKKRFPDGFSGEKDFDLIAVDEFQDSNELQYEFFKTISKDGKNLYLVGDVKQCIYFFRNADPQIFASLMNNEDFTQLRLNRNFRSAGEIIRSVNTIFRAGMTKSFDAGNWSDMENGLAFSGKKEYRPELVVLNSSEKGVNREAIYIARRIKEMVDCGFEVKGRPCGFGDFAVLTRTLTRASDLKKAFAEYGVPFVAPEEKNFTDLTETETAMAIMGCALRPNDDKAVLTALASPIYGFTAEELALLRLADENGSLYGNLSLINEKHPCFKKAENFLSDMRLFRKLASSASSETLLEEIYRVTSLPEIMSVGGETGLERRENLRLLLHRARAWQRPTDFLEMIKNIRKSRLEMPRASLREREDTSVKLMSIHKSKGLQFPIVFVSDCNAKPDKRDFSQPFIFDADGVGIINCNYNEPIKTPTASHMLISERLKEKVAGEETRLLYVAMTRAEEKLIVTANMQLKADKNGDIDESKLEAAHEGNHLDIILKRLEQAPDALSLTHIFSTAPFESAAADGKISAVKKQPIDLNEIKRKLNYKYPHEKATLTPAKYTATSLGVEIGDPTGENSVANAFYMGLPLFMRKNRPLTPKERGDVYHKVMENIDFSAKDAREELEKMFGGGIITENEKNAVDPNELQSFLDSEIAKRAAASNNVKREFQLFTTVNMTGEEDPKNEDLSFIQGTADMFFEENGGIVLTDYKTNRNTAAAKLIEEYSGQLKIYKKALEEMTGKKVTECLIFSFSLGETIVVKN